VGDAPLEWPYCGSPPVPLWMLLREARPVGGAGCGNGHTMYLCMGLLSPLVVGVLGILSDPAVLERVGRAPTQCIPFQYPTRYYALF
jgi:hypothetical protein